MRLTFKQIYIRHNNWRPRIGYVLFIGHHLYGLDEYKHFTKKL